jgi:outer membrane receptor protein involved in Fe transport
VVNIITKKAPVGRAVSAEGWGGTRESYDAHAAAEAGDAAKGLRLSYDSRAEEGHPGANGGAADDFLHLNKLNARGRWTPLPDTEVEFLGGGSWMTAGLPGLSADAESRHAQNFEALRGSRDLGGLGAVEASFSRAETTLNSSPLAAGDVAIRTYQYDAEALHRFAWLDDRVNSNWGAGWRFAGADSDQAFGAPRQSNRSVRAFTHHSVILSDPLTFVGGASLERSDTGGLQPAWQAAFLLSPTDRDSLRASYSYATTAPPLMEQNARYLLKPNEYYVGNPSYGPEKLSSWELGWTGRLLHGALKPAVSLYYMEIHEFSGLSSAASGPDTLLSTVNNDRAFARGAEVSGGYALAPGVAVFANYAFERITHRQGATVTGQDVTRSTPRNKVNLGARALLAKAVTAAFTLGYKDAYAINSDSRGTTAQIGRHFRLDARLAWSPRRDWEVFAAGQELLQPRVVEFSDGTASPRLFRAGVKGRFDF